MVVQINFLQFIKQRNRNKNTYVNPAKMSSKVLLPAPEGPIIAVSSPDLKSPLIPCRICFSSAKKDKKGRWDG